MIQVLRAAFVASLAVCAAASASADTISAAGSDINSSVLPGSYAYVVGGFAPGHSGGCGSPYIGVNQLPSWMSVYSNNGNQSCFGWYTTVTLPGGAQVGSGLLGHTGVGGVMFDMFDVEVNAGAPSSFSVGLITNVDGSPYDYPDAIQVTSSLGGTSGVITTAQTPNPSGEVDTYLFNVSGASTGEILSFWVQETTPNPCCGDIPSMAGITVGDPISSDVSVPEPAAIALLGITAVALRRRRHTA